MSDLITEMLGENFVMASDAGHVVSITNVRDYAIIVTDRFIFKVMPDSRTVFRIERIVSI